MFNYNLQQGLYFGWDLSQIMLRSKHQQYVQHSYTSQATVAKPDPIIANRVVFES